MKKYVLALFASVAAAGLVAVVVAQPPPRMHQITKKGTLNIRPATSQPSVAGEVNIEIVGEDRIITSNGIPNHKTGSFPNRGNPNRITPQSHQYRVPANPKVVEHPTPMHGEFGVAINGVPFDPGAGEFYDGEPGWQYEPLSGAIDLGIDVSHAHVQPTGKYHYHGLPTGLIDSVKVDAGAHSPLVGWAADGFPMYAVYGHSDPKDASSSIVKLTSSYRLKKGDRPGGDAPSGEYDGTFVRDYEYVDGSGDLDECNGRFTITPEYPDGTYAYFLTEEWPVVPRMYRGTPSSDFRHGPGGGRGSGRGGPMAGQRGQGGGPRGGRDPGTGGPGSGDPEHRGPEHRGLEHRGLEHRGLEHRGPEHRGLGGPGRVGPPPRPGQVLPDFVQDSLDLSSEQRERLATLQAHVDAELEKILTPGQQKELESPRGFGPPGFGPPGFEPPGFEPPGFEPPGFGPPSFGLPGGGGPQRGEPQRGGGGGLPRRPQ